MIAIENQMKVFFLRSAPSETAIRCAICYLRILSLITAGRLRSAHSLMYVIGEITVFLTKLNGSRQS
jgi:hypothetical protein